MSRESSVRALVSFGVKYAPLAYEGLRRGKGPAKEFADRQVSRRTARSIAFEHAAHLVDGSVLPVYDGDVRVWVVFSGDRPVGTHPVVNTPVAELLAHYDLDKRMRPHETTGRRGLRRRGRSSSTSGPQDAIEAPRATGDDRPGA
ncbi:hypothetical protein [Mobilicoccus pelagius]|uniref:Uncharacterized protein n=1 Tax=Mobilicoccus pelagius NBRC 104925 TaxID=1089455 RepID=H5UTB5_9MICO|nr:hypothetical protein [Mobilicoccus pelagius]GAB48973.1 hypothetical protein MOPEL_091_00180 [Mobilicoccus pelagius NBRC 104925]